MWLYWISSTWLARVSLLAIVATPRPRRMVIPQDSSPGSTFVARVASSSRKSVMSSVANSSCSNSAAADEAASNAARAGANSDTGHDRSREHSSQWWRIKDGSPQG